MAIGYFGISWDVINPLPPAVIYKTVLPDGSEHPPANGSNRDLEVIITSTIVPQGTQGSQYHMAYYFQTVDVQKNGKWEKEKRYKRVVNACGIVVAAAFVNYFVKPISANNVVLKAIDKSPKKEDVVKERHSFDDIKNILSEYGINNTQLLADQTIGDIKLALRNGKYAIRLAPLSSWFLTNDREVNHFVAIVGIAELPERTYVLVYNPYNNQYEYYNWHNIDWGATTLYVSR